MRRLDPERAGSSATLAVRHFEVATLELERMPLAPPAVEVADASRLAAVQVAAVSFDRVVDAFLDIDDHLAHGHRVHMTGGRLSPWRAAGGSAARLAACSASKDLIARCSFSNARTSIWRTRSREMP